MTFSAGPLNVTQITTAAAVASYTGPGDVAGYSGAYAYWGLRGYNAAYATGSNPCVDIVDQANANQTTINILSTGAFDVATFNAWVATHSVTKARIKKLYDQSGNARHLDWFSFGQSPELIASGGGLSIPSIKFDAYGDTTYFVSTSLATTQAQPVTVSAAARFNAFSIASCLFCDGTVNFRPFVQSSAGALQSYYGTADQTFTNTSDDQWTAITSVANGASSTFRTENASFNPGVVTAGATPGASGIANTNNMILGRSDGSQAFNGYILECLIKAGAVSSANQALLATNQRAYGSF